MKNRILEHIQNNNWEEAATLLSSALDATAMDDTLAVLAATIQEHYENFEEYRICIETGLAYNPYNYELYLMLGNYYATSNPKLAYLSYENAEFHCEKSVGSTHNDYTYIHDVFENYKSQTDNVVAPVSFVILSYNTLEYTKVCVKSIRTHCKPGSYELIFIDNASTDGSAEWLEQQTDIKLIKNTKNVGFAAGCNQGIECATPGNDIFLLNNDTIMMPNALYTLRMSLYSSEKYGSAGSCTNFAGNHQTITEEYDNVPDYEKYAIKHNLPRLDKIEIKSWLIGFAVLIKNEVINKVGGFDTLYGIGNYEDNDLGLQILKEGYQNILCWNSFIFHWGHKSFNKQSIDLNELLKNNLEKFKKKWNFNPEYFAHPRFELLDFIDNNQFDKFNILEVGCGLGATLNLIKYKYPNAITYGVEIVEVVAELANTNNPVVCGNIETLDLPYEEQFFDYIILGDVIEHLTYPEEAIKKLSSYLKPNGRIVASIPNVMNAEVIYDLLHGNFTYQDAGILDRTHLRFFTAKEIFNMFSRLNYSIESMEYTNGAMCNSTKHYEDFFNQLLAIEGVAPREQFDAYQYIFKAIKLD